MTSPILNVSASTTELKTPGGFMKKMLLTLAVMTSTIIGAAVYAAADEGCVIAGPSNAPLTIEEYSDFECPYCAKGAASMKRVLQEYPGKVKLVLRNLPLPMHSLATPAAKAFTAVWLQNPSSAYEFQDQIFTNQGRLIKEGESFLLETAKNLGIDIDQMKIDMEGDKVATILKDDAALAKKYGFNGTPSFRIGNESVRGAIPYDEIKAVIDRQLGN
jgi:protein-disulfide isomerase